MQTFLAENLLTEIGSCSYEFVEDYDKYEIFLFKYYLSIKYLDADEKGFVH